jgi:tripartite-type tricarboxylate transporter receptor subunit TctC
MNAIRPLHATVFAALPLVATILGPMCEARAQQFPSRVVTIVVPTAPATPPDIISRVIATELSESEGWRVVVENKAGAVLIATGKLRALAVTGPRRIAALGDTPTIAEQGFPNLSVEDWVGFAVKSGTPNEIVVRLNATINKALTKPKVREAFGRVGADPAGGTPSEYGELINSQVAHWAKVVRDAGLKMQQ